MNLKEILKKHEMWLKGEESGERADLSDVNLRGANLRGADLRYANLKDANLRGADLRYADLRYANLIYTNLSDANLKYADLRNTNLSDAEVRNANLTNVKINMYTIGYHLACPEEGSFIGYKKAGGCIVKLLILEDAKRSSGTTMKCRCDRAKVLDIENIETGLKVMEVSSDHDSSFMYRVGEIIEVDNFDDDRWNECAPGIHFFMNRENAINY